MKKNLLLTTFCALVTLVAAAQASGGQIVRNNQRTRQSKPINHSRARSLSVNEVKFLNSLQSEMRLIEGGSFKNGDSEINTKSITVKSFYILKWPVTQQLWKIVMGTNPSSKKNDNYPVDRVSWKECQTFISKLNQLTHKKYRLPTDNEWEFAARGGNLSKGYKYNNYDIQNEFGWTDEQLHPVGTKKANEQGLYDMAGTLYEWTDGPTCYSNNAGYGKYSICKDRPYIYGSSATRILSYHENLLGFRLAMDVSNDGELSSEKGANLTLNSATYDNIQPISSFNLSKYNVVLASFPVFANARTLCSQLRASGYKNAQVYMDSQKIYRVIGGCFSSELEALRFRSSVRNKYPDVWILYIVEGKEERYYP